MRSFLSIFVFLLCGTQAEAALRLAIWNPPGFKYAYILPLRENESLTQAVVRYQQGVNMNSDLRENIFRRPLRLGLGTSASLEGAPDAPRALLLANKAGDLERAQAFVKNVAKPLQARGLKAYVLPVSAELGLSGAEAEEFRSLLAKRFDLLVGMGGDDVHPFLYREPIRYAKPDLSMARDISEFQVIKRFLDESRGFYLGICRGSQLLGVISGCTLVQDIEIEKGVAGHRFGFHQMEIQPEAKIFKEIFPAGSVRVNTLHHEAVKEGSELLTVAARDPFGITEGTELVSGRGVGIQSHPEMMGAEVKAPFFDRIVTEAKIAFGARHAWSCEKAFGGIR